MRRRWQRLLKLVPLSQVLFGSDYPYLTITQNIEDLRRANLTPSQCAAVECDNALALLSRLRAACLKERRRVVRSNSLAGTLAFISTGSV
jgi:Tat protein secretion system quality control protein TatD with DNase activity